MSLTKFIEASLLLAVLCQFQKIRYREKRAKSYRRVLRASLTKVGYFFGLVLVMTACSSSPRLKTIDHQTVSVTPKDISLPISSTTWNTWRCQGDSIQTRYQNDDKTILRLKYQGQEHLLAHQASRLPAIYENQQLAFYSDGKAAVIGAPLSDKIYLGGCRP